MSVYKVLFALSVLHANVLCENLNLTGYFDMPKMYAMDKYEKCFEDHPVYGVYCIVDVRIKPDNTSTLWNYIQDFSRDFKRHFRHDDLVRGLCINDCQSKLSKYDYATRTSLYQEKFPFEPMAIYNLDAHPNGVEHSNKYGDVLNQCVNLELKTYYSLMGYSTVTFCSLAQEKADFTNWDRAMITILLVIVGAMFTSSIYDYRLRSSLPKVDYDQHFQTPIPAELLSSKLVVFSITRNLWYLIKRPSSKDEEDLLPFQGVRTLIIFFVMLAHVVLENFQIPISNTETVEQMFYAKTTILITNGTQVIQTMFVMSAFLLGFQFSKLYATTKESSPNRSWLHCTKIFILSVISRVFRLLPLSAFVLLFRGTLFQNIYTNPMWKKREGQIAYNCKQNWWTNILFVNNIVDPQHMCNYEFWFLATEMQLFVFGAFLLVLTIRFPRGKPLIFGVACLIGLVAPAVVTYINAFDAIYFTNPQYTRTFLNLGPVFRKMYIPMYTNISSHVCGLVAGIIWFNLSRNGTNNLHKSKIYKTIWVLCIPTLLFLIVSGNIYNSFVIVKPSIWISIFASALKNLWAICCAVILLGFAAGIGGILRNIAANQFTNVSGKLALSAYCIHVMVIVNFYDGIMEPKYVSDNILLTHVVGVYSLTMVIALFLYLLVERPVSNIVFFLLRFLTKGVKKGKNVKPQIKSNSTVAVISNTFIALKV